MKEIKIEELIKYVNPLRMEEEPAILMVSDGEIINGMTIGWAGIGVLWNKYMTTVYVHKQRYSKQVIDKSKYFAICFMKDDQKELLKYFGTVSYRDEDKVKKCGLKLVNDAAPYFEDSKVVILCRIMGQSDFDVNSVDDGVKAWYQRSGVHSQYYGEIVKVLINE